MSELPQSELPLLGTPSQDGMKTDLPEPAEYYRPARARELREEAARLERGGRTFQVGLGLSCLIGLGGMLAGHGEWFTLMALLPLAVGSTIALYVALPLRAHRLRAEAEALEAEHAARYGALPPGEAS